MRAMFGNLDHTAELEAPSVRAGRFTVPIHESTVWPMTKEALKSAALKANSSWSAEERRWTWEIYPAISPTDGFIRKE